MSFLGDFGFTRRKRNYLLGPQINSAAPDPFWNDVLWLFNNTEDPAIDTGPSSRPLLVPSALFGALPLLGGAVPYRTGINGSFVNGFNPNDNFLPAALTNGPWTLETWMRIESGYPGTNRRFWTFSRFTLTCNILGAWSMSCVNIGGTSYSLGNAAFTQDNLPHHFAFVREKGAPFDTLRFYLDGVQIALNATIPPVAIVGNTGAGFNAVLGGALSPLAPAEPVCSFAMSRMTRACRYPGGLPFTPPTWPLPNFGP